MYRVNHRIWGQPVAVKIFHDESREKRYAWRQELNSLIFLTHANIVRMFYILYETVEDCSDALPPVGYVMEEMARSAADKHDYTLAQLLDIFQQIATALNFAHSFGVVHFDVKPENILLDDACSVAKLCDFGCARKLHETLTDGVEGQVPLGTLLYMAPELFAPKAVESLKRSQFKLCDIYSFGKTMWKLLHPSLSCLPCQECKVTANVPVALRQLVEQCTLGDATKRPQEMLEVVKSLQLASAALAPRPFSKFADLAHSCLIEQGYTHTKRTLWLNRFFNPEFTPNLRRPRTKPGDPEFRLLAVLTAHDDKFCVVSDDKGRGVYAIVFRPLFNRVIRVTQSYLQENGHTCAEKGVTLTLLGAKAVVQEAMADAGDVKLGKILKSKPELFQFICGDTAVFLPRPFSEFADLAHSFLIEQGYTHTKRTLWLNRFFNPEFTPNLRRPETKPGDPEFRLLAVLTAHDDKFCVVSDDKGRGVYAIAPFDPDRVIRVTQSYLQKNGHTCAENGITLADLGAKAVVRQAMVGAGDVKLGQILKSKPELFQFICGDTAVFFSSATLPPSTPPPYTRHFPSHISTPHTPLSPPSAHFPSPPLSISYTPLSQPIHIHVHTPLPTPSTRPTFDPDRVIRVMQSYLKENSHTCAEKGLSLADLGPKLSAEVRQAMTGAGDVKLGQILKSKPELFLFNDAKAVFLKLSSPTPHLVPALATPLSTPSTRPTFDPDRVIRVTRSYLQENGHTCAEKGISLAHLEAKAVVQEAITSAGDVKLGQILKSKPELFQFFCGDMAVFLKLSSPTPLVPAHATSSTDVITQSNRTNLYVNNFATTVTDLDFLSTFQQYGNVTSSKVETGKGFGFVNFSTPEEANAAIAQMNGKKGILGSIRPLKVCLHEKKEDRGTINSTKFDAKADELARMYYGDLQFASQLCSEFADAERSPEISQPLVSACTTLQHIIGRNAHLQGSQLRPPAWPRHEVLLRFDLPLFWQTTNFFRSKTWCQHFFVMRGCRLYHSDGKKYPDTPEGTSQYFQSNPEPDDHYCIDVLGMHVLLTRFVFLP